jgi:asparagine synthase (glutamine-hydrolysing)
MPGIVGLITKLPREVAEPQLLTMLSTLRHEPFYLAGTWCDESMGVYVGWTVAKDSFSDGMPVCNERHDAVLIFSGEEYSEPDTALRLREKGHTQNQEGPSYLVHLYEDDPAFPANLNGLFHGLVADRSARRTTLFNDRYGMHRIYYHESKQTFYFAAEAKAILAVRPELRTTDPQGLGEFVSCGCVLQNRTLFKGIEVLPGGSAWIFGNGALQKKRTYFQPREWEEQEPLEPDSYYRELREVFSRNLPRYFNGKRPIGMSLTGGLDTRLIMAWRKAPPGGLPCYTFGGTFRDCQDVLLARRVARACSQSHEVIRAGDGFLSQFSRYAERTVYLTDGCADVSRSPVLYANERAGRMAPVRMTGNYGDELLRRVRMFKPVQPAPGLFSREFHPYIDAGTHTYKQIVQCNPLTFTMFRQAPWHNYPLLALEDTQLTLRSPFLDNDLVRTVYRAPESSFENNDIRIRLIDDGNRDLRRIRTDLGFAGSSPRLLSAISRKYLRFTFRAEYAYNYGMPQWLARIDHLFSGFHLERIFLGRHKYCHFRVWYRDQLASYVREILLGSRTLARSYIDRKGLEAVVRGHLRGDRNYTTEIHKVLTLELLHRLFLDPR